MVGPPDTLQERCDASRRTDLADELHRPDVDAELERGGGDESPQFAGPQPGFDSFAPLPRQAAVVRRHLIGTEPLTKLVGKAL